jgi:hypothetical protein
MGASTSMEQQKVSAEQREVENQAASTGALPMLRKAFSNLADPQTNAIPLKNLQVFNNPYCLLISILFSIPKKPISLNSIP